MNVIIVTASYHRPMQIVTEPHQEVELHIDPVVTEDLVVYGFSPDQVKNAVPLELPDGTVLELSRDMPQGAYFVPLRYSVKRKAYLAPAIGKVVLRLAGRYNYKSYEGWDAYAKLLLYVDPEKGIDENVEAAVGKNALEDLRILEGELREQVDCLLRGENRPLIRKVFNLELGGYKNPVLEQHAKLDYGLVVVAKTEALFAEDVGLREPEEAAVIDKDFASMLFNASTATQPRYIEMLRPIRGFAGDAAEMLLQHLAYQQR